MNTLKPDSIITELCENIQMIMFNEVLPMLETRATMKKLREKLQLHPTEVSIDELASALQYSYVGSMVMAVCRQTDDDRRTMSLHNLLHVLLEHSDIINRTWLESKLKPIEDKNDTFYGMKTSGGWIERVRNKTEFHHPGEDTKKEDSWGYSAIVEGMANDFFNDCGHLNIAKVRKDTTRLLENTKIISQYRNKFIAHSDKKAKLIVMPQFHDLDKAVDIIKELTVRYYLLLHQADFDTSLGYVEDGWLALLPSCK